MKERSPGLTKTVVERVSHSGERVEIPVAHMTGSSLGPTFAAIPPILLV